MKTYSEQEPVFVVAPPHAQIPGRDTTALHNQIAIKEIDDSVVVDFSLEKFKSIRFTVQKKISLFFEHTFPWFLQSLFVPVFHVLYNVFFAISVKGRENLDHTHAESDAPLLFISNHIGWYDSFMFDLFVPPFTHVLPFRFMGSRRFIVPFLAFLKMIGVVDIIYFLFGVFRITPGEGAEKSLKKAYEILKNNGTVVMYPEGRIWHPTPVHPEPIGQFKWGAAILAKNTGVKVVPVSIRKSARKDSKGFPKLRDKIDIRIGEPYHVDGSLAPEVIADDMRRRVLDMFEDKK